MLPLSLSPLSRTPQLPREILWKKADIVSPSQVTEILNQRAAAIVEVCTQDWTLFLLDENDQKQVQKWSTYVHIVTGSRQVHIGGRIMDDVIIAS